MHDREAIEWSNTAAKISAALDNWLADVNAKRSQKTRIERGKLEATLGLPQGALSPCRVSRTRPPGHLLHTFDPDNLRTLVPTFLLSEVEAAGYFRLCVSIHDTLLGWRPRLEEWACDPRAATLKAEAGLAYLKDGLIGFADGYFDRAWPVLRTLQPEPGSEAFRITVLTGTAWAERCIQRGNPEAAVAAASDLMSMLPAGPYGGSEIALLVGDCHRIHGYVLRHVGNYAGAEIEIKQALRILRENHAPVHLQLATLNNLAKLHILRALGERGAALRPSQLALANYALRQAFRLVPGEPEGAQTAIELVCLRDTQVELWMITGDNQQAIAGYEATQTLPWVGPLLAATVGTRLRSRHAMTELAYDWSRGALDVAVTRVQGVTRDPRFAGYSDRTHREHRWLHALAAGDTYGMQVSFFH